MNKKALLTALLLGVAILTLSVASPTFAAQPTRGGPSGGGGPGTGDCTCDGTGDCTADGAYQQRFMIKNSLSMGFGR
jgi:hypothetical protein